MSNKHCKYSWLSLPGIARQTAAQEKRNTTKGKVAKAFYFALAFIFPALIAGCYPHRYYDDFQVTAQFEANGLCSFSVDNIVMSSPTYRQNLSRLSENCIGCTADNLDGYVLRCEESPYKEGTPVLYTTLIFDKDATPGPGTYRISKMKGKGTTTGTTVQILHHPDFDRGGLKNGLFGAHISAIEGKLTVDRFLISQVNKKNIRSETTTTGRMAGRLTARARREMNGP